MLDINKQKMKYAKQGKKITVFEKDESGNVKSYTDMDGNTIPIIAEEKTGFFEPKVFFANISNKLSEVLAKEFGIDDSTNYCQIVTDKGYLPLKEGDIIWKRSEVGYDSDRNVDPATADYIVKGVADEGLTADLFLLQKNVK
jgi:hypothetical protein|nr:MAG TPA_asm: hypothetical protein [Caudoviricetes sp.]